MRLAMIVPRYGADVVGGAETLARGFAKAMASKGWEVEVWTTCAQSQYSWQNHYPAGVEQDDTIAVHRFPVQLYRDNHLRWLEAQMSARQQLAISDQYTWLECGAHSEALYRHIAEQAQAFDVLIAMPYAAQLIHYAAWVAPEKTLLWPCLHTEPLAFIEPVHLLLETVRGVIFNSPEEQHLTNHILQVKPEWQVVLGGGVSLAKIESPVGVVSSATLVYSGRLEPAKNLALLYAYVRRHSDSGGDIELAVMGRGPFEPPEHPAFRYLGFVSEVEKARQFASALAVCQPSLNESFSLVMMESWLAGRPALVHGLCAVTRGHVHRSQGGLWFDSYESFVDAVTFWQREPEQAAKMGQQGRNYVLRHYRWPAVVDRFERFITDLS